MLSGAGGGDGRGGNAWMDEVEYWENKQNRWVFVWSPFSVLWLICVHTYLKQPHHKSVTHLGHSKKENYRQTNAINCFFQLISMLVRSHLNM